MRMFSPKLADELLAVGPAANIDYAIRLADGTVPKKPCEDLRHKLWVAVNLPPDYDVSETARLTVVRLDNVMENREGNAPGGRCPLDKAWLDIPGWSTSLQIKICSLDDTKTNVREGSHCTTVHIPPTKAAGDVFTTDVTIQGLSPAITRDMEIPRRIIRVTHDSVTDRAPVLDKIAVLLRILNPKYEQFEVFASNMLEEAAKLPDGERVVKAINSIQPMAYKVDIYRVAELLHRGGVYCDSKIVPSRPFDSWLPQKSGFFPFDIGYQGIWNGFMAFPAEDPMMKRAFDLIEESIAHKYYGSSTLAPTGPDLVLRAFNDVKEQSSVDKYTHRAILDNQGILIVEEQSLAKTAKDKYDPKLLIIVHNAEYRRRFTDRNLCHYSKLWEARAVYYEVRCDPNAGLPWNTQLGSWNHAVRTVAISAAVACFVTLTALTAYIIAVRCRQPKLTMRP